MSEREQGESMSTEVLDEYRRIQQWLERQDALLGPVGDTMHGLAAEALDRLIERVEQGGQS